MESPAVDRIVFPNVEDLSRAGAFEVCRVLKEVLAQNGRASIALTGGRTSKHLYTLLATEFKNLVPWDQVDYFWGDERYVPPTNDTSNFRMAHDLFLGPVNIPSERIHPFRTSYSDPHQSSADYEKTLRSYFGPGGPRFDVVLLGVGADGHIASLFPGSPALYENARLAAVTKSPLPPPTRVTLTFPALNGAQETILLVAGEEKREAVATAFDPALRQQIPAGRVHARKRVAWLIDTAANG